MCGQSSDIMKKLIILLSISLIAHYSLYAQVVIKGRVKDNRGRPLPSASVTLKDTYDGATADSLGNFSFSTNETGTQTLVVTNVGYKPFEQPVNIGKEPIVLNISLKEQLDELRAVTVTAGSFAAGDNKRGTVLSSLDVATTAGSNADITAALKTLPGTQQVGEKEGLFVRGGAGYEAKQYIDGTLVNNPYSSSVPDISSRGRFSPFLFKGTVFSTGGYSAEYGQALSSVVLLESIDLPDHTEVDASVSPLVLGVGTQQLAKNKKSSWGASYNYVNVGLYFNLVKQTPDYFKMPQFHSGDANFRIKTKSGGIIKYYTTFSYSNLGLRRPDVDSLELKDAFSLKNTNWYNNISWRENLGGGWRMRLGASYSTNNDDFTQQVQNQLNQPKQFAPWAYWMNYKNFTIGNRQDLTQLKAVFEKKLAGISSIRFGTEYWYSANKFTYNDTARRLVDHLSGTFVEANIFLTNDLAAQVGTRFEYSSVIQKTDIAPRLSLAYKTGKDAQVSVAYGQFYQKPENTQLFYTTNIGFTKATHYIVNYQKMNTERIFRVEAYYKTYDDLIKTVPVGYNFNNYNNSGSGYAKGVDVFFRDKKTIRNFDYWLSYSYVDTKRNYLNYTGQLQPDYAATHTASLVMKRFFTNLKSGFNATYTFATGRPYYNFLLNNNGKYYLGDQGKTKPYNSLNFSAEYIPSLGKTKPKSFIVLFASITNVLGYNAVYSYNYSYSGAYKQAVEPPAKRFFFIGCFISWGVDRTQDAINNNL